MRQQPTWLPFNPLDPAHIDGIATLWNAVAPPDLPISSRFVRYNVAPVRGGAVGGQLAVVEGEIVGVALVSTVQAPPELLNQPTGWVDLLAVHPAWQRQGLGRTLILWAERWLMDRKCERILLGTGLRPFMPGTPVALQSDGFFQQLGYQQGQIVYDLAANLAGYTPPATVREIPGVVRPAQPGDEAALDSFLAREFPGRWRFEFQEFCRTPNYRISDYMLLWTERGVDGFCCLTFADSHQPIERFYPYTLSRPWGQLGSVGVSADCRGRGYGAAVVDGGLRRLHNNGINGCVIDWTTIVDFYGKFGFTPYRDYRQFDKKIRSL